MTTDRQALQREQLGLIARTAMCAIKNKQQADLDRWLATIDRTSLTLAPGDVA